MKLCANDVPTVTANSNSTLAGCMERILHSEKIGKLAHRGVVIHDDVRQVLENDLVYYFGIVGKTL